MTKNTQQAEEAPGADAAIENAITVPLVKEYLVKDLSVAISCLNAIQSDPDLLENLAVFMAGRWANAMQQKRSN